MKYVLCILAMIGLLAHMGQWTPGQHDNQPVQTVVNLEIPK